MLQAIRELKEGGVVAFPTETVYGLGASIEHPEAIQKIFALKGRPKDNPLIVHVASIRDMEKLAFVPEKLYLLKSFWPGPLTVVLKHRGLPDCITAGLDTVALRIPDHPIALQLVQEVGPLVAPSANLSGFPSPTEASHVQHDLDVLVLDGGPCREGLESTVLTLVDKPAILRPGALRREVLEAALGEAIGDSFEVRSPGMKYRHYAPRAKLRLFETEEALQEHIAHGQIKRIIKRGITPKELYRFLRACDAEGAEEIALLLDEKTKKHAALMNRLKKAAL